MILVDANSLIYAFENEVTIKELCYVTDDLEEEYLVAGLKHGQSATNVSHISDHELFDEAYFYEKYIEMMNKYTGNFGSMRGFADISILAALHCAFDSFGRSIQVDMFAGSDFNIVYTNDERLIKKILKEFNGQVVVKDPSAI